MKLCKLNNSPEIFASIQGEGKTIGKPAIFIRLAGCSLRCQWCDTKYSWEKGIEISIDEIIEKIKQFNCNHIVITGGEPLLQDEIYTLIFSLRNYSFEIETNGTISPSQINRAIQYNVSPKLSNSGNERKENENAIRDFVYKKAFFKFVIKEEKDINEVLDFIMRYKIKNDRIYLMPECIKRSELKEKEQMVVELCKRYNLNYSPRIQIDIWDNKKGV